MKWIYNIGVGAYHLGVRMASPFNAKAKKWLQGRKGVLEELDRLPKNPCVWFHCASLGEFEMGRPVLEALRKQFPEHLFVVTFFSPSGYEVQKDYHWAAVCYLPQDNPRNARRFLDTLDVRLAVFVKYDFWYHYLIGLKQRQIPTYLISGLFRNDQPFFKGYGQAWVEMINCFNHCFVQEQASAELLKSIGYDRVSVTGDTRFDRVLETINKAEELPDIASFIGDRNVIIAGSCWEKEEELLIHYFGHEATENWCIIFAPHDISEKHVSAIEARLPEAMKAVRYSQSNGGSSDADALIIDNVGLLARAYRYANIAVIGGAFGSGLHNILEAAAFGVPVIFGPNHQRFPEAQSLINAGGAYSVHNQQSFDSALADLMLEPLRRGASGLAAADFVKQNSGASEKVVTQLASHLS